MSDEKITAPDMNTNSTKIDNRRSFLKKGGLTGVLGLTVASRPALGAVCNISGFASINPSGVTSTAGDCGGLSHGAWKNPYSNGAGNLLDWHSAGAKYYGNPSSKFHPNPDPTAKHHPSSTAATLFVDIFGVGGGTLTLHDALNNNGSLISEAATAFLNACFYNWGNGDGKLHPEDVIGLYKKGANNSYTTRSGSVITVPSDDKLQEFFKQTHH